MVAKDIFSFASVTDGCEEANLMGIFQYIYENELTSENMYLPIILAKRSQFHFSFFKGDSQNPKFSLEYLRCTPNTCTALKITTLVTCSSGVMQ